MLLNAKNPSMGHLQKELKKKERKKKKGPLGQGPMPLKVYFNIQTFRKYPFFMY